MSPSRKIAAALDENTRAYDMPCTVTVEDGPNKFHLNLTALDSVGAALDTLEFVTTDRQDWSTEVLNAWGQRLAAKVTYLLEPLKVLEIDSGGGEVQIRSQAPTARAQEKGFYQVSLYKQGLLRMERYVFDDTDRQRRRTPCKFTREVLERLADDIAATAS